MNKKLVALEKYYNLEAIRIDALQVLVDVLNEDLVKS